MGHLDQELPNLGVGSAVGEAESGQREQEKERQDHHHDHADREIHPSRAGQSGGGGGGGGLFFATYTLWANRMCTFCRACDGGGSCLLTRNGALELVMAEGKKDETKSAKE